jgi:ATP-binding cassette, subfamily B, multidrug efflux pump
MSLPTPNLSILKRLLQLTRPYRFLFVLAGFLSIILAPVSVIRPALVQHTVDAYILQSDYEGLLLMLQYLFGILIIEGFLAYVFSFSTNQLGQSIIRDLRVRVFKHINSLRLSYFDKTPIGTNTTRTINDMETINTVFSEGIITIIADILTLLFVLGIMFYTSWKLTLVCLAPFPLLLIGSYWFKEAVKKSYEAVRNQVAIMNTFLQERISGMRIVQIFNTEEKELAKFDKINQATTKANLDAIFAYAVFFPLVEILSAASLGLMVWYGAGSVVQNELTLGVLIAFPLYLGQLFRPVRMLADKFNSLQMGLIAANRVFNLLDTNETIPNKGTIIPTKFKGDLAFKNVFFSYVQDTPTDQIQDWILKDVSFSIAAGETLAIVGSTGAGKSTIISILNRFYQTQKGEVLIDGTNIEDFELYALRKRISIVLQDVFLFSGTVLDNIRLNDAHISREQVVAAAKLIGAHEFIEALPDGYDYEVRERGATLSMGQRQLISFVRALVFAPDILILDEATSSIDPETENIIQVAIEKLILGRTSIVIAHRLSTIQHADKILVLDKGKVVEFGTKEALMDIADGFYKKLVLAGSTTPV